MRKRNNGRVIMGLCGARSGSILALLWNRIAVRQHVLSSSFAQSGNNSKQNSWNNFCCGAMKKEVTNVYNKCFYRTFEILSHIKRDDFWLILNRRVLDLSDLMKSIDEIPNSGKNQSVSSNCQKQILTAKILFCNIFCHIACAGVGTVEHVRWIRHKRIIWETAAKQIGNVWFEIAQRLWNEQGSVLVEWSDIYRRWYHTSRTSHLHTQQSKKQTVPFDSLRRRFHLRNTSQILQRLSGRKQCQYHLAQNWFDGMTHFSKFKVTYAMKLFLFSFLFLTAVLSERSSVPWQNLNWEWLRMGSKSGSCIFVDIPKRCIQHLREFCLIDYFAEVW